MRFVVNAEQSRFTVQAFAAGLLSRLGHSPTLALRDMAGEVEFEAAAPQTAAMQLRVTPNSLALLDDVSASDRQEIESRARDEVLEAGRYTEIVYQSAHITAQATGAERYRVRLIGELTLRGITRAETIDANVLLTETGLRARGGFALRQSDYGIAPVTALGGALKLKDELELAFDIVADAINE